MGRWLTVRVVAWGLRGGISAEEIERRMRNRFKHRDVAWRWDVIGEARARNVRKLAAR
jgi:hypothetical protein